MGKDFLQIVITDRTEWLGLQRRKDAVMTETESFPEGWDGMESRKEQLQGIYSTLSKYERLEALSLLEEFLWSMEMDKALSSQRASPKSPKRQKVDCASADNPRSRQICRVNCGAGIVIPNILPFLD